MVGANVLLQFTLSSAKVYFQLIAHSQHRSTPGWQSEVLKGLLEASSYFPEQSYSMVHWRKVCKAWDTLLCVVKVCCAHVL